LPYVTCVDPALPDPFIIEGVSDTLLNGGVVALPTDTVYGLAADATNVAAVRRLYELKGRSADHPIALLISEMQMLRHISPDRGESLRAFLGEYWPGPLTVILSKYRGAFAAAAPGHTVGVRMPNHNVTLAVISLLRRPLAVTSANLSGESPAVAAEQVRAAFGQRLDLIVDAGPAAGSAVSTVLDLTIRPYRILREGAILAEELRGRFGEGLE
jgi:L-threonylcarbamoyladenylate synthase